MEVSATAKYIRVQPRKVRIIADEIRGKDCGHAAALLHHHTSKGAKSLRKVLINAMANAAENHGLAPETLKIATIMVDQGPVLKRMTAKGDGPGRPHPQEDEPHHRGRGGRGADARREAPRREGQAPSDPSPPSPRRAAATDRSPRRRSRPTRPRR